MSNQQDQTPPTISQMKAEAKTLRDEAPEGARLSHCASLEAIAKRYGFANWNTARAQARPEVSVRALRVGTRVAGRYLTRRFIGELRGIETVGHDLFRVTVRFDKPVDVVRFDSFSAFRSQVNAVLRDDGTSVSRLSTGDCHLVLHTVRRSNQNTDQRARPKARTE